ncbi:MAG TPA: SigE family RNA polymerase sigma factor [Pilimelia sp.]|nr:SigE family RNA polymerase sigma factor [Pilimelia sp.]
MSIGRGSRLGRSPVIGEDSFRAFVDARYTELLRVAYLLTGSAHEAEDLLQSSLLRAMRYWRQIDEPMAYVRRIMVSQNVSIWRRHRGRELLTSYSPDRRMRDATDGVAERLALFSAMRKLPPRTRTVIVLRYWVDLSEAATAELLGCSVGTVKSHASRGLARLREVLAAEDAVTSEADFRIGVTAVVSSAEGGLR